MYSPTSEQFSGLATQGNLIPVTRRLLADFETPLSAYQKLRGQGESFLFESVEGGEHLGRFSFVGFNPRAIIRQIGQQLEVIENGQVIEKVAVTRSLPTEVGVPAGGSERRIYPAGGLSPTGKGIKDGLVMVEKVLKRYRAVSLPSLPRFTGGAV